MLVLVIVISFLCHSPAATGLFIYGKMLNMDKQISFGSDVLKRIDSDLKVLKVNREKLSQNKEEFYRVGGQYMERMRIIEESMFRLADLAAIQGEALSYAVEILGKQHDR